MEIVQEDRSNTTSVLLPLKNWSRGECLPIPSQPKTHNTSSFLWVPAGVSLCLLLTHSFCFFSLKTVFKDNSLPFYHLLCHLVWCCSHSKNVPYQHALSFTLMACCISGSLMWYKISLYSHVVSLHMRIKWMLLTLLMTNDSLHARTAEMELSWLAVAAGCCSWTLRCNWESSSATQPVPSACSCGTYGYMCAS